MIYRLSLNFYYRDSLIKSEIINYDYLTGSVNTNFTEDIAKNGLFFDQIKLGVYIRNTIGNDDNLTFSVLSGSYMDVYNSFITIPSDYSYTQNKLEVFSDGFINTSGINCRSGIISVNDNFIVNMGSGDNNISLGSNNDIYTEEGAFRKRTITLGKHASSGGDESISIGSASSEDYATYAAKSAIAIGNFASAAAEQSNSIGYFSSVIGNRSIAIGSYTESPSDYSVALGYDAYTNSNYSVAVGALSSTNTDNSAIAIGYQAEAHADNSIAIGYNTNVTGDFSIAIGMNATESTNRYIQLGNPSYHSTVQLPNGISVTSDIRDKTDIEPIPKALDFINKLTPFTYVKNDRKLYDRKIEEMSEKELEQYHKYELTEN